MKVKNKKTGKIGTLIVDGAYKFVTNFAVEDDKGNRLGEYSSLAELNDEWEDYEEPKEYWYIYAGKPQRADCGDMLEEDFEQIGNHFVTKEEAEKAVEKLKAWKRLKDKGFRFTLTPVTGSLDIIPDKFQIGINADMPAKWFCCDAVQKDLDVCFGVEE